MAKEATRIQTGAVADYTAAATIANGDVLPFALSIGIALDDAVSGDVISVDLEGAYEITATTADTFAFGDTVYFDPATRFLTSVNTHTLAGVALSAKAGAAAGSILVKIG